MIYTN